MVIAFVITNADSLGGAQVHVRDLSKALIAKGHKVMVFHGGDGIYARMLEKSGIPHTTVPSLIRSIHPLKDIKSIFELRNLLKAFSPDVISTHSSKAGIVGRLAGALLKIPTLFTAHGWAFTDGVPRSHKLVYLACEKLIAPLSAKIITVSNFDKVIALKYRVAAETKIVAIHNGMPNLEPNLKTAENEEVRLIMIARFVEQKDHGTLIEALGLVNGLNWKLTLIGDGPLKSRCEQLAKKFRLEDKIEFVGETVNVVEHLNRSDIFLLISNWEGFPRSILEAMRAGLPVIASDAGGAAESVEEGRTGFIVPKKNPAVLAEKLNTLIQDKKLRQEMGERARKSFENQFTFDHMFERTAGVYREITGSR